MSSPIEANLQFESANFIRRLCAYLIDIVIIIVITYLVSMKDFKELNNALYNIENDDSDAINIFKDAITKYWIVIILKFIFVKFVYFTLIPAIIGDGKTIGKFFAGISVVDVETLAELKPINLILRELVYRIILEDLFILPKIASVIISLARKDSRSLHDLLAHSVVIRRGMSDVSSI